VRPQADEVGEFLLPFVEGGECLALELLGGCDMPDVRRPCEGGRRMLGGDRFRSEVDSVEIVFRTHEDAACDVGFDGSQRATHIVNAFEICFCPFKNFVGEGFDSIAAAEGVDGIGDAAFVRDDLLGT